MTRISSKNGGIFVRFREFGGKSIFDSNAPAFEAIGGVLVKISTSKKLLPKRDDCYHVGNGISNIFTRNGGGCVRVVCGSIVY